MILLILSQASLIFGRWAGRLRAGRHLRFGAPSVERELISSIPLSNLSDLLSSSQSRYTQLIITVLTGALLIGLLAGAGVSRAADGPLLVAAAADLAELEGPLSEGYEKATGERIRFTTGASGMLARQVENGAPYDVFLSANERFVKELVKAGRILPESAQVYATGRLGLWSRSGEIRDLKALTGGGVRRVAIATPAHAPYGAAARQALERSGLWRQLEGKLVYGENVRQAFEYAESGNADAVITSWTLLSGKGGILLSAGLHDPIRQAGGAIRGNGREAAARRFLEFLVSLEGQRILRAHGLGGR